jgi:hypothetical protein
MRRDHMTFRCTFGDNIVACSAVYKQRLGKHVPAVTDMHVTIYLLLEKIFSTRFMQRGYKEDKKRQSRVEEAGSNNSIVAL